MDRVGIDLGTTYSAVGYLDATHHPRLIPFGERTVCPSVVHYPETGDPIAGWPALRQLAFDPEHTVRSAKRFMGQEHRYWLRDREVSPEHIQAAVLSHLLDEAGAVLGGRPSKAVITVPAYFDQRQREATREAGRLAGVEVERLLNEPTAAALAHRPDGGVRQVLVYDFGGGTFDVSLVRQDGDLIEVLASHGDTHLGGDDLDRALADLVVERWAATHGLDASWLSATLRADVQAATRLDLAVEEAKRRLSSEVETTLRLEYLIDAEGVPKHLEVEVERAEFERRIEPLLERTLGSVEQVLRDGQLDTRDLDAVLLVGGSTRVPAVWSLLHRRLSLEPDRSLHPEECVAMGAAVQAGLIAGAPVERVLVDVAPFSLSVSHLEPMPRPHMRCKVVTPRNTPLPSRYAEQFVALRADQEEVVVYVFQGGAIDPLDNVCIGCLRLSGLARRAGEEKPEVTVDFAYDLDGVVQVTLSNLGSGRHESARLRVEGLGRRSLIEDFVRALAEDGIAPGPDREVGEVPTTARDLVTVPHRTTSPLHPSAPTRKPSGAAAVSDPGPLPPDLAEDFRTVERIAERIDELEERYAERSEELRASVDAARAAFTTRPLDRAAVERTYDRLTDLLFDLGEFF